MAKTQQKGKQQKVAEQATGCSQSGSIIYYDKEGNKITIKRAIELLNYGETVEVPSAGSGNYEQIFTQLGFEEVKVIDWSSSAGDWCFGVKDQDGWYPAFQENRYPYHGFKYSIGNTSYYDTFRELEEEMTT